jgi:ribosomal-protein-serine acetyltransferase
MDLTDSTLRFNALRCGLITLWRITEANFAHVQALFSGYPDSAYMLGELLDSYRPSYDQDGRQNLYGFYATLEGVLSGGSLLGVSSWMDGRGYTGADTFLHMRGRGVAPGSKPHLFYLGFGLLGLNRIETGCLARTRPPGVRSRRRLAFNSKGL